MDGDESLFDKLLGMFLNDALIQIDRIQEHLKGEDLAGVRLRAHSLSGAAVNICANALQKAASEVEAAAKDRDLDRSRKLVPILQQEFERFKASVGEYQPS